MKEKTDPRKIFSPSAEGYLSSTDHRAGPDLELIRRLASELMPLVTVDVACGAGHALRAAAPYSGRCVALDMTPRMLATARAHLEGLGLKTVLYLQARAESLPLACGSIALLTCRIAPHHFSSVRDFLREVHRVLEPGGRAVIIDSLAPDDEECRMFINKVERMRDSSHVETFTRGVWRSLYREAGLKVFFFESFERTHAFDEWARRVGLDDDGVAALEGAFLSAPDSVRRRFAVTPDGSGGVASYTDEKGMWVVGKGKARTGDPGSGPGPRMPGSAR